MSAIFELDCPKGLPGYFEVKGWPDFEGNVFETEKVWAANEEGNIVEVPEGSEEWDLVADWCDDNWREFWVKAWGHPDDD